MEECFLSVTVDEEVIANWYVAEARYCVGTFQNVFYRIAAGDRLSVKPNLIYSLQAVSTLHTSMPSSFYH